MVVPRMARVQLHLLVHLLLLLLLPSPGAARAHPPRMHARTHARTHTHAHVHTHTYTHTPSPAQAGELVCFDSGVKGMALNLQADHVGIVVFGSDQGIHQGDLVYRTGQIINVPIGPGNLGRVLDALGQPIDGKGPLTNVRSSLVEVKAPGEFRGPRGRASAHTKQAAAAAFGAAGAAGVDCSCTARYSQQAGRQRRRRQQQL